LDKVAAVLGHELFSSAPAISQHNVWPLTHVEHLGVLQNVLSIVDEELTGHQNEDRRRRLGRWLGIEREDPVDDFGKW
jgi:hypothetical protein